MGCFNFIKFLQRPFWKKNKKDIATLSLQGPIKIDIYKRKEAVVLEQLRKEGILATSKKGGVAFVIGHENSFHIPKQPVVLPPLFTTEDKINKAVERRAEILEKKGISAKQSDARRKSAAKRRMVMRKEKMARVLTKTCKTT